MRMLFILFLISSCSLVEACDKGTLVVTPHGSVPIEDIKVGMEVFSLDSEGMRVPTRVRSVCHFTVKSSYVLTYASGEKVRLAPFQRMSLPYSGPWQLVKDIAPQVWEVGIKTMEEIVEPFETYHLSLEQHYCFFVDSNSNYLLLYDTHPIVMDVLPYIT